jgi:hypothetical protein
MIANGFMPRVQNGKVIGTLLTDPVHYIIWSEEHLAWWRPAKSGYTRSLIDAGCYSKNEAEEIVANANKFLPPEQFNEIAILDPLLR